MDVVLQPLRAYEHWLAQYRRVWRGTIGTSLVNPILYLAALGVGLGTLVDRSQNAPGGRAVPGLRRAGPARHGRHADRCDRATWPVMAAIKWTRTYYAMTRDAARRSAMSSSATSSSSSPRCWSTSDALPLRRRRVRRGHTRARLLVSLAGVLVGTAFSCRGGVRRGRRERHDVPDLFRFVIVPMSSSGACSSPSRDCRSCSGGLVVTPIWHGVEPAAGSRSARRRARTRRPCRVPARVDVIGLALAERAREELLG